MKRVETAFVFPGQGSHSCEMLQSLRGKRFYQIHYPLLCDLLKTDVMSQLEQAGPSYVRQNEVASLLTVFASMASWEDFEDVVCDHSPFAGYSVGQWTALAAAQALSVEDLFRVVSVRARLMNEAAEGAMCAVIGLSESLVTEVCEKISIQKGFLKISNFNAPQQYSLSGTRAAIAEAIEVLSALKARKCIPLDVSGPWHCRLLDSAEKNFASFLSNLAMQAPRAKVIDNVTGEWLPSEAHPLRTQLAKQISSPVRWEAGIRFLAASGVQRFIEVGHGNMLTKFGFFITREAEHQTLSQFLRARAA